jgi:hypothetical protein
MRYYRMPLRIADSGDPVTASSVTDRLPDRELLAVFRTRFLAAVTNVRRPPSAPVTAPLALRVTDIWRGFAFAFSVVLSSLAPPSISYFGFHLAMGVNKLWVGG